MEAGTLPRVAPQGMPTLTPRLMRLATDTRLVSLVREGRDGAFEAVYDRHHKGILSFCRHMLGDADEAEDAVQHTFMAAYSDLLSSTKPIHLRAWLFTIARNRCYTILRARREHPSAEIEEAATEGLASQVQRRQDLRDLVSDMRRLPDDQRAALVLAELDSLSHADISEILGVPREKVKALVFQARESLLASRSARDTACADIREQLACGRAATLRRANLRRHLRDCDGCRAFRAQVERQRKQFAVLLPVVPGIALKEGLFGGAGAAAVGAGAVGGGVIASSALKGGALKGIVTAIVASVSTAGTLVVAAGGVHVNSLLHDISQPFAAHTVTHQHTHATSPTSSRIGGGGGAGGGTAAGAFGHGSSASSSTGTGAAAATAAKPSSLGVGLASLLVPTKRVTRIVHVRLQAPYIKHHHHVVWPHAPAPPVTKAPSNASAPASTATPVSTPASSTPVTPVTTTPVSTPPVTSTPATTPPKTTVATTPATTPSTPKSGTTHTTGTVMAPVGASSGTRHGDGSGASSGAGSGSTTAVTVVSAGRGNGSGVGSRYGDGSGGSTGDSSSGSTTTSGVTNSGGTRGAGSSTATTSAPTSTTSSSTGSTTSSSTPVIGGNSTQATTTTSSTSSTPTSTTSTPDSSTPGRTLAIAPGS